MFKYHTLKPSAAIESSLVATVARAGGDVLADFGRVARPRA